MPPVWLNAFHPLVWVLFGIAFLAAELLVPGTFYLFFIGLAALSTALAAWLFPGMGLVEQGLVFSGACLLCLGMFRRLLRRYLPATPRDPDPLGALLGSEARTLDPLPPRQEGRVEFSGTTWSAYNVGDVYLQPGALCVVEGVDGLRLSVSAPVIDPEADATPLPTQVRTRPPGEPPAPTIP